MGCFGSFRSFLKISRASLVSLSTTSFFRSSVALFEGLFGQISKHLWLLLLWCSTQIFPVVVAEHRGSVYIQVVVPQDFP